MHDSSIRNGFSFTLSSRLLRVRFLLLLASLCFFLFFCFFSQATFHLTLTFFADLGLLLFIVEVTDGILELELAFILDLECALHFISELHWSEVQVAKWRDRELAEDSFDADENRDLLVLFLLFALENDHGNVTALLRFDKLLLNLAHEANIDVDVLIWLKLAIHGSDSEHLLCDSLLHAEVEANRVLTLILKIERKLLGLTNSDSSKVELSLHGFIQGDVECLAVEVDCFLFLLNTVTLNILNFELDLLKEFLLLERIERDLNSLRLARFKAT